MEQNKFLVEREQVLHPDQLLVPGGLRHRGGALLQGQGARVQGSQPRTGKKKRAKAIFSTEPEICVVSLVPFCLGSP